MRPGDAQLVFADLVEEPGSVAQNHGHARHRVPNHIAEAAQPGEGHADPVPVRVQRHVLGGSDHQQPLRRGGDDAGVGYIELQALPGRERLGEGHGRLVQLPRMVCVGVQRRHLEGHVFGVHANPLPVQRRGDLQRDARQRSLAVVAHRHQRAHGDLLGSRTQPNVHVEARKGDRLPLSVLGRGRGRHLHRGLVHGLRGMGRSLPVLVHGARKDDLPLRRLRLLGGSGLGAGNRSQTGGCHGNCYGPGKKELHEPKPFCFLGFLPALGPTLLSAAPSWTRRAALRRWRKAS